MKMLFRLSECLRTRKMALRRLAIFGAVVFSLVFLASARDTKAATVRIDNYKNEKVKICVYRSTDKTWLNPLKCWTLKRRESVNWNRGRDTFSFDVRVFRPGIIDKRLCQIRGIRNISRLYINSRTPCLTYRKRANRPPPNSVPVKVWKTGDSVVVNRRGDAYWYPARILSRRSSVYQVRFANGSRAGLHARYISGDHLRTGTRIYGNWKNRGRYYPGRIATRNGNTVKISYDDGDVETTTLAYVRLTFRNLPKPIPVYSLRVCNTQNDRVYFSLAFAISQSNYVSEGWWFVNPGGCITVDLSKRWRMKGIPANLRSRTYIYGETKGSLGGIIKKVWEGSDSRYSFCVNGNKDKYYANYRYSVVNGVVRKTGCGGSDREMLRMNEVKFTSSKLLRWSF